MKGSEILLNCLNKHNVDTIFGYPGGSVIPLYDALYEDNRFTHIRTAHEQGATHAADGYARSTGKVGVVIATSGPGATNTVTGIATAYMDSVPMVIITGQVTTDLLGRDSFQETDITGITFSITKHNFLVRNINELSETVDKAFKIATEGRPGPVLIDIPKDIFINTMEEDNYDIVDENKDSKPINKENVSKIIDMINKSKKPIIYAGGGVKKAGVSELLTELCEKLDTPVISSIMGLGGVSRENPLSLGMVGMHGFKENNIAVSKCDLLIGIGARFSDRVIGDPNSFASKAKIVHIDIDSSEVSKNIDSFISEVGDINKILTEILNKVEKKDCTSWREEINSYKEKGPIKEDDFHPVNIIKLLNDKFRKDTFVVTDVGQHQMWAAQNWKFNFPNSFITSGGLGTMGFGLGAAIGAQMGNKDNRVVLVTGDGSFRMNCNELFTLKRYNIPVTIVLLNNNALGMVRQWQRMFFNEKFSETDIDNYVDYVNMSKSFGIDGYKAESVKELKEILSNDDKFNGPVLIECKISKDENVYPIVPPGEAIESPITSWEVN